MARRFASPSDASLGFPPGPFVAPVGYEIMPRSPSEQSFNWSQPVLRQRNMVKVSWLTAADAATHHSRRPVACSGLPSGPER